MASRMAKTVGWELPDHIIEKRKKLVASRDRNNRKRKNHLLSDKAVNAIFSHYDY